MKKTRYILGLVMLSLGMILYSCQEDDQEFGDVTAPTNLTLEATVLNTSAEFPNGDGSGLVNFVATADGAISYEYFYGDGTSELVNSGEVEYGYKTTGTHEYIVTVVANGTGGASTSTSVAVTVFSAFEDTVTQNFLTGGASKTWYVASALSGHLGVGPVESATPDWYSAPPNDKESVGCFYNDVITISEQGGIMSYVLDNQGATFFNADFLSVAGGSGSEDQCLTFDTSGTKTLNLASASSTVPEEASTGTQMIISDGGFMSYYIGTSSYEILEITEDYMQVRAIPSNNATIAWYLKFTTDPEGGAGATSTDLVTEFPGDSATEATWSQEFDGSSLDTSIWNFETGNGTNGWGNNELQYYTDQNTEVSNGTLKINAIAESIDGYNYSSARITTQDKFDFQYGRIEVRAKLPSAGGTWPAIWMLGSDFATAGWPETGEIDIMEHVGNNLGEVLGTLHYTGYSAGNAISEGTTVENVDTEFHNYTMEWTQDHIVFAVDNVIFHEFTDMANTPFVDHEFFLILNIAMGGTLGGTIDPAFTQDTMEVDYIRVYQ